MTDLTECRALAAAARGDTSDGLLARERLADIVDELAGLVEELRGGLAVEWGVQRADRYNRGLGPAHVRITDEDDAITDVLNNAYSLIEKVTLVRRVVSSWVEVPVGAEVPDGAV